MKIKIKGIKRTITSFLTEEEARISDDVVKYGLIILGLSASLTPAEAYRCEHSLQHSNHCSQHANCQHTSSHSNGGSHCNQHVAHSSTPWGWAGSDGHSSHSNASGPGSHSSSDSHGNHSSSHCSVW